MAAYTIALTTTATIASDNTCFPAGNYTLTVGDATPTTVAVTGTTTKSLNFGGYGTVSFPNAGTGAALTYAAGASVGSGTVTITAPAGYTITTADFTNAAGAITLSLATNTTLTSVAGSAYNDSITGGSTAATINGGAGNDTLVAGTAADVVDMGAGDDYVNISVVAGAAKISLGAGADTVNIAAIADFGDAAIKDYNYADGDVIKLGGAAAILTLDKTGKAVIADATNGTIQTTAADSAYKLTYNNNGTTEEHWTAVESGNVTFDASSKTNVIYMDAAVASSAYITSGLGNDQITLSASGKNTLSVSKASGHDTIATTKLDSSDTVIFTGGGSLKDVSVAKNATGELLYSNTTLSGALTTTAGTQNKVNVSFDAGKTTSVLKIADDAGALTQETGVDYYLGTSGIAGTTLSASKGVDMVTDSGKYSKITRIAVTGAGNFIGAADATTAIDATSATDAVAIWGGSTDANAITMGAADKADTVWFGTADGKGVDTVKEFTAGFGATADVLKMYDTSAISKLTFTNDANGVVSVANGSSKISITASDATNAKDQIKVMLSDGTVKKVATEMTYAAGTADTILAAGADVVIGSKDTASTNVAKYDATQTDAVTVNLWDTDAYKYIGAVNTSEATGGATVIGAKGGTSALTLGDGANQVWGGSTDANTITLMDDANSTDIVWYGAAGTDTSLNDGADVVNNFKVAQDTVKFWDVASAKEIFKNYSLSGTPTATQVVFKSSTNTDSTLTVNGAITGAATDGTGATVKITDSANDKLAAVIGTGSVAFATDAQIYDSSTKGSSVVIGNTVTSDVSLFLDNGDWFDTNSYYFGSNITTINGAGSAAKMTLIGRDNKGSMLVGGVTENAMWGGGVYGDTMIGSTSAVDTIWFGSTDGADAFSNGVDKGDTIHLWDVSSANIGNVKITLGTNSEDVIIGSSVLSIGNDTGNKALTGGLSFTTSDNVTYTYDSTTKALAKKA